MSPLPSEFVGLWERIELTVDGRVIHGAGRSLWFQAGERYLDVRLSGGGFPSEAFGGTTTWDPSTETLAWAHALDIHARDDAADVDDQGRVEWIEGDLVEHGTATASGTEVAYTEVWRRRAPVAEPVVIADRMDGAGRVAWCGRRGAVVIDDRPSGSFTGGTFTEHGSSWRFDLVIGAMAQRNGRPLSEVRPDLEFSACGARWQIAESRPSSTDSRRPR